MTAARKPTECVEHQFSYNDDSVELKCNEIINQFADLQTLENLQQRETSDNERLSCNKKALRHYFGVLDTSKPLIDNLYRGNRGFWLNS